MLGAPIPVLRSFDDARTKAFHLDFLGVETVFEHRFDPESSLRIPSDDVVAYARLLSAKSAAHTHPALPVARPWGTLEITIHDPSGNGLTFYSPDPAAQEPA